MAEINITLVKLLREWDVVPLFWQEVVCPSAEGNGTPLQYSCLESPMDGGAWWAAFHGVAKSQT